MLLMRYAHKIEETVHLVLASMCMRKGGVQTKIPPAASFHRRRFTTEVHKCKHPKYYKYVMVPFFSGFVQYATLPMV